LAVSAVLVLPAGGGGGLHAQTAGCARADFESVVGSAAGALRDLAQRNTPVFQGKLRDLKDKRGWSHDQFLREAAPFVQDDKIAEFDGKSEELLGRIAAMGQEGASAATPDCTVLTELKGIMQGLVDTQQAKWAYMFGKLDAELAK
jgi:hypothetical protein